MEAYQEVFSALLRLRRAAAVLDELWVDLVHAPGARDACGIFLGLWAGLTHASCTCRYQCLPSVCEC